MGSRSFFEGQDQIGDLDFLWFFLLFGLFARFSTTYLFQHSSMTDLMAERLRGPPMTLATCWLVSTNEVVRGDT